MEPAKKTLLTPGILVTLVVAGSYAAWTARSVLKPGDGDVEQQWSELGFALSVAVILVALAVVAFRARRR